MVVIQDSNRGYLQSSLVITVLYPDIYYVMITVFPGNPYNPQWLRIKNRREQGVVLSVRGRY
jgi:hypothetical protein